MSFRITAQNFATGIGIAGTPASTWMVWFSPYSQAGDVGQRQLKSTSSGPPAVIESPGGCGR